MCGLLAWLYPQVQSKCPKDYVQFWAAYQGAKRYGVKNIYDLRQGAFLNARLADSAASPHRLRCGANAWRNPQYTASPTLYAVFGLVSSGNFARDYDDYVFISLSAVLISLLFFCRLFRFPFWATVIVVPLIARYGAPIAYDFHVGNVNSIQLGVLTLVAACLFLPSPAREIGAGSILAAAIFFKPNLLWPAFLLGCDYLRGDRRRLAWFCGALAVGAALTLVWTSSYIGSAAEWSEWRAGYDKLSSRWTLERNFLGKIFGPMDHRLLAAFQLLVLAPAAAIILLRQRDRDFNRHAAALRGVLCLFAGVAAMLIGGHMIHAHYFILALPLGLYWLRFADFSTHSWTWAAALFGATCLLFPARGHGTPFLWGFVGVSVLYAMTLFRLSDLRGHVLPNAPDPA